MWPFFAPCSDFMGGHAPPAPPPPPPSSYTPDPVTRSHWNGRGATVAIITLTYLQAPQYLEILQGLQCVSTQGWIQQDNFGGLYIGRGPHGRDNHRKPKIRPEGARRSAQAKFLGKTVFLTPFRSILD